MVGELGRIGQEGTMERKPALFRQRVADALLCQSCRRYRRGLFVVVLVGLAWWASGLSNVR
jgi:hypothetical protein